MTTIRCREQCPDQVTGTLKDKSGNVVPGDAVSVCELTLWDLETYAAGSPNQGIINSRNAFDLLGSEEVTISADGAFVWNMAAADNTIVNSRRQIERHRATLHFEWSMGSPAVAGETNVELEIEVENLQRVS